jgi:hypothetical protein
MLVGFDYLVLKKCRQIRKSGMNRKNLEDVHAMYKFQGDYIMRLIEQTDYPPLILKG